MDIQNSIADLQLIGTSIRKINLNNNFTVFFDTETIHKHFDMNCHIGNITKEEDQFFGNIILNLVINIEDEENEDSEESALALELEIEGGFRYQGDDESEFREMLEVSGSASVYSIARSIVTTITSQTFDGDKVILPMLNFFNLINDCKQESK